MDEIAMHTKLDFIINRIDAIYQDNLLVQRLLEVLIKKGEIHRIQGYAIGVTSLNDPFVLLYPENPKFKHKVCRVYSHSFKDLPSDINVILTDRSMDDNPTRDVAKTRGVYHESDPFTIATIPGQETQMGNEKRFYLTLPETDTDILSLIAEKTEPTAADEPPVVETKEQAGVTLSQAQEIQKEHMKQDKEDYDKGVYENEQVAPPPPVVPEHLSPSQQVVVKELQDNGHLPEEPRDVKMQRLNDELFGGTSVHEEQGKLEKPFEYKDGKPVPPSPFVEKLFEIYYETLHNRPETSNDLQDWYKEHVTWLKDEHDLDWHTFKKERDNG